MKNKKEKEVKPAVSENKDINMPNKDIKIEEGQPTFLHALRKIVKKNKSWIR